MLALTAVELENVVGVAPAPLLLPVAGSVDGVWLEEVPEEESLWDGACFVFDGRVSVGHGLEEGAHVLCHACRRPLAPEDLQRPEYERGVSCHLCLSERSEADRARYRERQKQIDLGRARGRSHLG